MKKTSGCRLKYSFFLLSSMAKVQGLRFCNNILFQVLKPGKKMPSNTRCPCGDMSSPFSPQFSCFVLNACQAHLPWECNRARQLGFPVPGCHRARPWVRVGRPRRQPRHLSGAAVMPHTGGTWPAPLGQEAGRNPTPWRTGCCPVRPHPLEGKLPSCGTPAFAFPSTAT